MRYSKQRELILQTLQKNAIHPSAEQLYELIKREEPAISLATVYRNLNLLAQQKIIKKIDGLEETSHFDHNICPHHHFFCKKCKRIFDINIDIIPNKIDEFLQKDGMNVEEYEVSFRGICANCQNKI